MQFEEFFSAAMGEGRSPYPYQTKMAGAPWPDLLEIPTGLGKTAAVTLAWAWKRGLRPNGTRVDADPATPRRLVWCLPMRTLVEQTAENVSTWLSRLDWAASMNSGADGVAVHLLMGGEDDLKGWTHRPENEQILIGTQDMLLSRALMRGYGMSRYQWPVHFALLHNDALWVFDEVQLMGPALPTSTQLEAFRRSLHTAAPARSLWVSATLDESWLDTIDFRQHRPELERHALGEYDLAHEQVQRRVHASKSLRRAETRLDAESAKRSAKVYVDSLAEEILSAHIPGEQTLVIINRVERAQALYRALSERNSGGDYLLLHARFRRSERDRIERCLHEPMASAGRIVVATQAVEAGMDIDSHTLFTELAPWASLVQRFGRCNRAGRFDDAEIRWIDIEEADDLALPYSADSLTAARKTLYTLTAASPAELPPVTEQPAAGLVLRKRDLLELFNTDPDLSGFDVDVSPYIRDTGTPQAQVFWRQFSSAPDPDEPGPGRDEICPVSMTQLKEHLKKGAAAWQLDTLARGTDESRWERLRGPDAIRPGQVYLLNSDQGGYRPREGFVAGDKSSVQVLAEAAVQTEPYNSDRPTAIGRWVALSEHLVHVADATRRLGQALDLAASDAEAVVTAARWHDVGKAHEAFIRGIGARPDDSQGPWAKSDGSGRPDYHVIDERGKKVARPYFRHELASMLAWLEHGGEGLPETQRDLVAYLVASHHGRVRLGLRALPGEQEPSDPERLFARGIWAGDSLPALVFDGETLPETTLRLDLMQLGDGPQGPSWTARTRRLLEAYGPFRLAWLEALVRIADWRASADEEGNPL